MMIQPTTTNHLYSESQPKETTIVIFSYDNLSISSQVQNKTIQDIELQDISSKFREKIQTAGIVLYVNQEDNISKILKSKYCSVGYITKTL